MEKDSVQHKSLKQRLLQKKVLLILSIVVVLFGIGGMSVVKASDNPTFCTLCHNMQPMYDSYHDSNLLANYHAKTGVTCHDCHESSIAIQAEEGIKYITGNFETPMKTREFSKDMCLKCHDSEKIKPRTNFGESNPHDSHNGELECNLCHKMHEPSTVFCDQCHSFPWAQKNELPAYFKSE